MSTRTVVVALAVLAASVAASATLPVAAHAQPSRSTAEWPVRLSAAARAELAAIADSTRAAGAPTDPLYDKAAEGVLKRADDARIVVAVRRLGVDLRASRDALGTGAVESEVALAASALRMGVTRDALRQLARARVEARPDPRRPASPADASLLVPISALAELVAGGVAPDVATRAVAGFVARGGSPAELAGYLHPLVQPGPGQDEHARALLRALDASTPPAARRPDER